MNILTVIDKETGEELEKLEFSGGYDITFANNTDAGNLKHVRKLNNGKFGDKHWIKNFTYRPIAGKLVTRFRELEHINVNKILFIEDMNWAPPENTVKPKRHWIARIKKANKDMESMTGYEYVLETRNYFIDKMYSEQIVALLYHELRHIDKFGDLVQHDIEDWDCMVSTLGKDWATTEGLIKDILSYDFEGWDELPGVTKQMNLFNQLKAVK